MKIHAGQGIEVVYHLQKIPVSSVGKFRTGRIVYHLQKIPIMGTCSISSHRAPQWRLVVRTKIVNYLEFVWKAGTCKWNKEIHSKSSSRENRTTFSDGPLISGVSSWMNQKSVCHLHSNRNFRNFLASGKQPEIHIRLVTSLGVWTRLIEAQNVLAARFSDLKYWKSS